MTKKTYPKTPRVSRSRTPGPNPPVPPRQPSPDQPRRAYPFDRHYADLDGQEEHPVDAIIDRIPRIATLDRTLVRLSRRWQSQVSDVQGYIDYEDHRLHQRLLRQEAYFDAGHREGRLVGLVECLSASTLGSPRAQALAQKIRIATMTTILPSDRIVAVLLEMARAFVLGQPLPSPSPWRRP